MNEEKEIQEEVLIVDNFNWVIPECCREGWDSCPHVVKRDTKAKRNIAL